MGLLHECCLGVFTFVSDDNDNDNEKNNNKIPIGPIGISFPLFSKSQQVETLVTMEADLDRGVPWL